ncbi:MAG: hypothetical protein NT091_01310 [Candidatus Falkowbacteria bacterium]|nr:hypothetical protein [Candidatus Falkowbacteria bacterium]
MIENILELFLPKDILEWFDSVGGEKNENEIHLIFKEKNIPPITEADKNKKVVFKGYKEFTVTDFPIRGRRALLTFKRRYWQIEGQKEYLKRDIQLSFPGTQLEKEFADFLKEDGGRGTLLANFYRKVSENSSQGI